MHSGEETLTLAECEQESNEKEHLKHFISDSGMEFGTEEHIETDTAGTNWDLSPNPLKKLKSTDNPFICRECGHRYATEERLEKHKQCHILEHPLVCEECGKTFGMRKRFTQHLKTHIGDRKYACEVCGKSFFQKGHLRVHIRIHTGEKPFVCKECGKAFRSIGDMRVHSRVHSGEKPYSCLQCGKEFSQKQHVKKHMEIHANYALSIMESSCQLNEPGNYSVSEIGLPRYSNESFDEDESLSEEDRLGASMHMQGEGNLSLIDETEPEGESKHLSGAPGREDERVVESKKTGSVIVPKPFTCKECGKRYCRKFDYNLHIRSHTGDHPYVCKECGKGFSRKCDLKRHVKTHVQKKPFGCDDCVKGFIEESDFIEHMKKHKVFDCKKCEEKFTCKDLYDVHMRTHSGVSPFSNLHCDKSCQQKDHLNKHLQSHSKHNVQASIKPARIISHKRICDERVNELRLVGQSSEDGIEKMDGSINIPSVIVKEENEEETMINKCGLKCEEGVDPLSCDLEKEPHSPKASPEVRPENLITTSVVINHLRGVAVNVSAFR